MFCEHDTTDLLLNLKQTTFLHHLRKNAAPFRRLTRQRVQDLSIGLPRLLAEDLGLERSLAFVDSVKNGSSLVVERHGEFCNNFQKLAVKKFEFAVFGVANFASAQAALRTLKAFDNAGKQCSRAAVDTL